MKMPRINLRWWLRLALAVAIGWALAWFGLPWLVPLPAALLADAPASPVLLDRHGAVIEHLTLPDFTRSAPVRLAEIPADLVACTVAVEDKRFFSHGGVDGLAIGRALVGRVTGRGPRSGASTITQQLIKVSSPPRPRTVATKLREALAARRLEMSWDKRRILEAYFDRLHYGSLRLGPAEATRWYFQKPMSDLSLAEAALLAGLPQAPTRFNPLVNPTGALARRDVVLRRLAATRGGDPVRIEAALREPLGLRPLRETRPAPWLVVHADPASPPGPIRTTLDLALQREITGVVREETAKLKTANLRHAAVVVIENASGEILALVSSANWDDPRGGQINGALAPRSPGSALKPFTYLLAIGRLGFSPATIIADIPSPFRTPQGLNLPENYDRTYRGPVTARTALACSLNVPALRVLNDLGGPEPLHGLLARLGVLDPAADAGEHGLGLTLGNAPVRLLDLTNAYAGLARGGLHLPPRLFCGGESEMPQPARFATAAAVYQISHILADAAARAPAFAPGGPLELPFPCAVKTGTSSDFRDNWCVGYTPDFTVGVWAGNFENQPMKGISGVAGAAPIFNRGMRAAQRGKPPREFERPPGLVDFTVDTRTGKRLPDTVLPDHPHARRELAEVGQLPPPAVAADYDADGRALLPPLFTAWFGSERNLRRGELALDPQPVAPEPLRIILPADGAIFLLDPEIPSGSDRLRPVTNLPGVARWTSPTLRIEPGEPEPVIHLAPGIHELTATDPRTGARQTLRLTVKEM